MLLWSLIVFLVTAATWDQRILAEDLLNRQTSWQATGWFRLAEHRGRHWLVTPAGHPFFNLGINHLLAGGGPAPQEDQETGLIRTRELRELGFNTAGYGAPPMYWPHGPFISLINLVPNCRYMKTKAQFPDVFDPTFQESLRRRIAHQTTTFGNQPNLLGYLWTDTPLWNPVSARVIAKKDWVSSIRQQPASAPGKQVYAHFLWNRYEGDSATLAQRYGVLAQSVESLLEADFAHVRVDDPPVRTDDRAFLRLIARQLYSVAGPAYRQGDPHHLILGEMYFQGDHPPEVLEEAMPHVDVLVIQPTGHPTQEVPPKLFDIQYFDGLYQRYGKPILIGDHQFSFATQEHPRTMWYQFPTAQEAASAYREFLEAAIERPYIIGYNRCQIRDAVLADGRLKQGVLRSDGRPHEKYTQAIAQINRDILQRVYGQAQPRPEPGP